MRGAYRVKLAKRTLIDYISISIYRDYSLDNAGIIHGVRRNSFLHCMVARIC
jgi:hypothetical protein